MAIVSFSSILMILKYVVKDIILQFPVCRRILISLSKNLNKLEIYYKEFHF